MDGWNKNLLHATDEKRGEGEDARRKRIPVALGQNAMAAGGTLAYLPGARELHGILTLYPGKSDFPTKNRYYRTSNAAINLIPSSFS